MEPFKNLSRYDYEKTFNTDDGKVNFILHLKKLELLKSCNDTFTNKGNNFLQWLDKKITESNTRQRNSFTNDVFKSIYKKYFNVFDEYKDNKWWFSSNPVNLVYYQLECLEKHSIWLTTFADFSEATNNIFEKALPNLGEDEKTIESYKFWNVLKNCQKDYNHPKLNKYKEIIYAVKKEQDETIDFERDVIIE